MALKALVSVPPISRPSFRPGEDRARDLTGRHLTEGVFVRNGTFLPLPKLATEPFLKLWEQEVFALLLAEGGSGCFGTQFRPVSP